MGEVDMTQGAGTGKDLTAAAAAVRLVVMDVDGTLTDGGIYIGNDGECCKRFHCRDGLAVSASVRHGLPVILLTGRDSRIIRLRAAELGLPAEAVLTGVADKGAALRQLLARYGYAESLSLEEKLSVLKEHLTHSEFPHEIGAFLGGPVGLPGRRGGRRPCARPCRAAPRGRPGRGAGSAGIDLESKGTMGKPCP